MTLVRSSKLHDIKSAIECRAKTHYVDQVVHISDDEVLVVFKRKGILRYLVDILW